MADTFSQMYIHLVFGVKFRESLIDSSWKFELYKFINGIINNYGHRPLVINGTGDHIHILIGYKPATSLSDLVKYIKSNSSRWINLKGYCQKPFRWQEGFGAFSYGQSQLQRVADYIERQEEHHRARSFQEEYKQFLDAYHVPYNECYLPNGPV
jgi:putative transposase